MAFLIMTGIPGQCQSLPGASCSRPVVVNCRRCGMAQLGPVGIGLMVGLLLIISALG